jgi:hypothetical protein
LRHIPVIEDYHYVGIDFSRDPERPIPPGEERGEMGKFVSSFFFCETYVIFMFFYIYINFFYTRVSDRYVSIMCRCGTSATCGLCKELASASARGHTCHDEPAAVGELPTDEAERVLIQVERNFTSLTRIVPMAEIEDLLSPNIGSLPLNWDILD